MTFRYRQNFHQTWQSLRYANFRPCSIGNTFCRKRHRTLKITVSNQVTCSTKAVNFFTVCYLSSEVTDRRTCDCHLTYRHLTFFFCDFYSQIYKLPKCRFPSLLTRLMCPQIATNWSEILKLSLLFIEKMIPKEDTFRHANFATVFDQQFLW